MTTCIMVISCSKNPTYVDLSDPSTREVYHIWNDAEYNAYSDLIRYNNAFYCAFRESTGALGSGGKVRIIKSTDGVNWESVQVLELAGDAAPPPTDLSFNGTNQYMRINHHVDFDFSENDVFSISTWVYKENSTNADFVATRNGGNGYNLFYNSGDLYGLDIANPYKRIHSKTASAGGEWFFTQNEWHHLGFVYDGPNRKIWLYQNGTPVQLHTNQTNDLASGEAVQSNTYGNDIFVGAGALKQGDATPPILNRAFKGKYRTMRFWNKAMTASDMKADMEATVTEATPNLIAGYDFTQVTKQGTQDIVPDIKGNHPGILYNFAITEAEVLLADVMAPKLTITPDNRLMLLVDGEMYSRGTLVSRRPYVSYSSTNGDNFSDFKRCDIYNSDGDPSENDFWIWNISWDNNSAAAYGFDHSNSLTLMQSVDGGESFHAYHALSLEGTPSKATIKFDQHNNMYVLLAKEAGDRKGVLAVSAPPYQNFTYYDVDEQLDTPNFIFLDENTICIAAQVYTKSTTQVLVADLEGKILKRVPLPSTGENGYPGLVAHDGFVWVSYHTSNSGKPDIYMAKLPVDYLLKP